jgi:serine/threonine protein kinase
MAAQKEAAERQARIEALLLHGGAVTPVSTVPPPVSHHPALKSIPWSELEPVNVHLGSGAFGSASVYKWPARKLEVVVKEFRLRPQVRSSCGWLPLAVRGAAASLRAGVVMPLPSPSPQDIAIILEEAALQAALEHDSIVRVYGVAMDTVSSGRGSSGVISRIGIIMPAFQGPLSALNPAALSPVRRLNYVLQIASGVAYLHGVGVVHGDLQPSNVLVAQGGERVAITDCGLAHRKAEGASSSAGSSHLRGGGTAYFMAPELFELDDDGAPLHETTPASDVFAFGVTAWCILAGRPTPYSPVDEAGRPIIPSKRVPKGLRPDLSALPPGLPHGIAQLLQRCWAPDPSARPCMAEVHAVLEAIEEQDSKVACVISAPLQVPLITCCPSSSRFVRPPRRLLRARHELVERRTTTHPHLRVLCTTQQKLATSPLSYAHLKVALRLRRQAERYVPTVEGCVCVAPTFQSALCLTHSLPSTLLPVN